MGVVKVYITNKQKAVKIPSGLRLLIRKCCHAVLEMEEFGRPAEVSVTFVDNDEIRALNREFRQKDAPTDVLSFPMGENGRYDLNEDTGAYVLGAVVLSVEKAVEQADLYGHSLSREVAFLTVHSMLHLLGYDHEAGGLPAVQMREKEETVLARLGLERDKSYVPDNI